LLKSQADQHLSHGNIDDENDDNSEDDYEDSLHSEDEEIC